MDAIRGGVEEVQVDRSYGAALRALSNLITRRKRADGSNWGDAFSLMDDYIRILELEEPISKLSVIHVAGTKGKGSTCCFTETVLRAMGHRTGLFTSPHLIDVRERFRFDGGEVSEELFLEHFWWCYDRLTAACRKGVPMPAYFRFLTLLALRLFSEEKVDVVLLEVGLGGRFDATNVVARPAVCGISSLGFDHMEILGNTLREIAGEKAGIFKPGVPAITSPQQEEAMAALVARADELQIELLVAPPLDSILGSLKLGLAGAHQRVNAALAVALCRAWALSRGFTSSVDRLDQAIASGKLPPEFVKGLSEARWPGRAQIVRNPLIRMNSASGPGVGAGEGGGKSSVGASGQNGLLGCSKVSERWGEEGAGEQPEGRIAFFLDGAHSPESMEVCAQWFCEALREEVAADDQAACQQVLLFNCMPERKPELLLAPLLRVLAANGVAVPRMLVVPSLSSYTSLGPYAALPTSSASKLDLSWQAVIQREWEALRTAQLAGREGEALVAPGHCPSPEAFFRTEQSLKAEQMLDTKGELGRTQGGAACLVGPSSVVMPTLPAALELLGRCVRSSRPPLRLQVLVTGSLHLVGDVMKLIRQIRH